MEDRRGQRASRRPAAAGGGFGLILILILAFVFKVNPLELLSQSGGSLGQQQSQTPQQTSAESDEMAAYVSAVLGSTEEEWSQIFAQYNLQYRPAKLINYSGSTRMRSGGVAQAATGPFYIPAEETVYLDTQFFYQLRQMSRDRTRDYDFAPAYVIAHEVAHHVQKLLGYTDKVQNQRRLIPKTQYNQLSVRLELQADFLAGVWAHHANNRMMATEGVSLLEEGDIEEESMYNLPLSAVSTLFAFVRTSRSVLNGQGHNNIFLQSFFPSVFPIMCTSAFKKFVLFHL